MIYPDWSTLATSPLAEQIALSRLLEQSRAILAGAKLPEAAAVNAATAEVIGAGSIATDFNPRSPAFAGGAKGDSISDDGPALAACLTAAKVQSLLTPGVRMFIPPGVYYSNSIPFDLGDIAQVTIEASNARFILPAPVKYGVRFSTPATATGVRIKGLNFSGTGVATDMQFAISTVQASSSQGSDIRVTDCVIDNIARGIAFDNGTLDSWKNVFIGWNTLRDIKGQDGSVDPNPGYGINNSGGSGFFIVFNTLERCGRHAIYQSAGRDTIIVGNKINDHRLGYGTGFGNAIVCARSSNIVIAFNELTHCKDGGISVEPREGDGTYPTDLTKACRNIVVAHNIIKDTYGTSSNGDIWVGTSNPSTSSQLTGVLIEGNRIWRQAVPTDNLPSILIMNGKNVRVTQNHTYAENAYTVELDNIYVQGIGGDTYLDDVVVDRNDLRGSHAGGGSLVCVSISSALCTSNAKITLERNTTTSTSGGNVLSFNTGGGVLTGPNIEVVHSQKAYVMPYTASMTPNPEKGRHAEVSINNNTAFALNAPADIFGNNNATAGQVMSTELRNTSAGALGVCTLDPKYKPAGALVLPAAGKSRVYMWIRRPAAIEWVELSRSPADI